MINKLFNAGGGVVPGKHKHHLCSFCGTYYADTHVCTIDCRTSEQKMLSELREIKQLLQEIKAKL